MLINFFNSHEFRKPYELSFSYRYSTQYFKVFSQRLTRDIFQYPLFSVHSGKRCEKVADRLSDFGLRKLAFLIRELTDIALLFIESFTLYRLLMKLNPDLLHINNGGYPAARSARAAAIAGKLAGVRCIVMVVNNMAEDYKQFSRMLDYPVDRLVVYSVNLFVTGSIAASLRLAKVLHLPDRKVKAIHNGIALREPTEFFQDTRKRLDLEAFNGVVFGVVALLIPRKGHIVLLEAINKIFCEYDVEKHPFMVLIEGEGPLLQELTAYIESHGLSRVVHFIGHEQQVVNFMSVLDALVLPSIQYEDFPNVILEAMALGKPVIASRLAGTPEQVLDGETGLLVEPRDIEQLAEALYQLIDKADLRRAMGSAALQRFNTHFTTQTALTNYSNLYTKLIENQQ